MILKPAAKDLNRRGFVGIVLSVAGAAMAACRERITVDQKSSKQQPAEENPIPDIGESQAMAGILKTEDTDLKRQARADYAQNFAAFGGRLSSSLTSLETFYDVVVIGSGYGAAITAARIAATLKPGKKICILERGKEWVSGDFPDHLNGLRGEMRSSSNPSGLFDLNVHADLAVLQGNGLGGSSLINGNVSARAEASIFSSGKWPSTLNTLEKITPFYQMAENIFKPAPTTRDSSGKIRVQYLSADNMNRKFTALPLNVQAKMTAQNPAIVNAQGLRQRGCTKCGDCMTGCNVGAKNTLPYNYLAIAKQYGTKMFCEIEANYVEKTTGGYLVHANSRKDTTWLDRLLTGNKAKHIIGAKLVVIAAGSPASAGILLRSKKMGLAVSTHVGKGFSMNANFLGSIDGINYSATKISLDIAGKGAYEKDNDIGPSIQSAIRLTPGITEKRDFLLEDLSVPRALVPLMKFFLGNTNKAMFLLGIGKDDERGRILLDSKDIPKIEWTDLSASVEFNTYRDAVKEYARKLKASRGSMFSLLQRGVPTTAHPLGGCVLSDSSASGTCNAKGQVFTGINNDVHAGLYVADASVVPTSLRVNPLLTISAVAEFIASNIPTEASTRDLFV